MGRVRRVALLVVLSATAAIAAPPTPIPEPPLPFGRVIYRAVKAAAFESLGVTMIACRHRDPVPRRFMVQFFDPSGRQITSFASIRESPPIPPGKKVLFVTDGLNFPNRDVLNLRLGHLSGGPARVISDAEIVHCIGKIRMDGGAKSPSYRDDIGFVREGQPLPHLRQGWRAPRPTPRPTEVAPVGGSS
jgi:hypothetical protein